MKTFRVICAFSAAIGLLMAIIFFAVGIANAGDISLQWNTVATATGYKAYYGIESGAYLTPEDTGTETTHTFFDLSPGTYFFAVTAYNDFGESGYSSEVTATILPPEQQTPPSIPAIGTTTTTYHLPDGSTVIIVKPL